MHSKVRTWLGIDGRFSDQPDTAVAARTGMLGTR